MRNSGSATRAPSAGTASRRMSRFSVSCRHPREPRRRIRRRARARTRGCGIRRHHNAVTGVARRAHSAARTRERPSRGDYPGTHDRRPTLRSRARGTQRRDPPSGRPLPPRQRRVAGSHRDPGGQGAVGLVPPHRGAGREGRARDRRGVAAGRARHRGAQDRRPLHELHGHRAHRAAGRGSPRGRAGTRRGDRRHPRVPPHHRRVRARGHRGARSTSTSSPTRATRSATCPSSSRAGCRFPTRATTASTTSRRPASRSGRMCSASWSSRASPRPRHPLIAS